MSTTAKTILTRTLGAALLCVLVLAGLMITAQAQSNPKAFPDTSPAPPFNCSNATLSGEFATRGSGWTPVNPIDPLSPLVPFANVTLMTFDGAGNLANEGTNSNNGFIIPSAGSGSYSLSGNCKGTLSISTLIGLLTFDIVVANRGTEFYMISTNRAVVTVEGKRVQ